MSSVIEIWTFTDPAYGERDIAGYRVEALDGHIGKIDSATNDLDGSFVVVDTGPWIFGRKVVLPAGVISRVDEGEETVWVNRTKEQIKNAPELEPSRTSIPDQDRGALGAYYGPGGLGWHD